MEDDLEWEADVLASPEAAASQEPLVQRLLELPNEDFGTALDALQGRTPQAEPDAGSELAELLEVLRANPPQTVPARPREPSAPEFQRMAPLDLDRLTDEQVMALGEAARTGTRLPDDFAGPDLGAYSAQLISDREQWEDALDG